MEEKKAVKNFGIILIVVLVCGVLVYFLTRIFVSKDLFNKDTTTDMPAATLSYNTAIVGTMLNRPEEEYYVMVYDSEKDEDFTKANLAIDYRRLHSDGLQLYTVDLVSDFNAKHKGEETKVDCELKDMTFGSFTLLKVKNGKITKTITDFTKASQELDIEE